MGENNYNKLQSYYHKEVIQVVKTHELCQSSKHTMRMMMKPLQCQNKLEKKTFSGFQTVLF